MRRLTAALISVTAMLGAAVPNAAVPHPHVFIDGWVDFVIENGTELQALKVTWLYDEFETLYTLASIGVVLNEEGGLDPADHQVVMDWFQDWPEDFDGSAHVTTNGADQPLGWPGQETVALQDGRLKLSFTRNLETPLDLAKTPVDVGMYEASYFFAFTITQPPELIGAEGTCAASVTPFDIDAEVATIRETLARLSREDSPEIENVGALFADRILVSCAG